MAARDDLLEAGYELLMDSGDLNKLKLKPLLDKAKVSSSAFYSVWDTLLDYQADLLTLISRERRDIDSHDLRDRMSHALLGPHGPEQSLPELVQEFAHEDRVRLQNSAGFKLWIALWVGQQTNEKAKGALRGGYADTDERWVKVYLQILKAYGLELRPPMDTTRLSTILTALLEGVALRSAVDPDGLADVTRPGSSEPDWDLFALTVAALLSAFVRKTGDADDRNVWQFVEDGLGQPMRG